jgi:phytanoyl-CoA dioxygenase PhyH
VPTRKPLRAEEVEQFLYRGFVPLREAFSQAVADECRAALWEQLALSPNDPSGWTKPVIRLGSQDGPPFREASASPRLRSAWDQLVGEGRWAAQEGVGGSVAVRFPVEGDPGDDGWHIDGSFAKNDSWWVNVRSEGRSLLMLYLFSDVGVDDAPTRIRVGSHLDLPALLAPAGEEGVDFMDVGALLSHVHARELALATGAAGDVYLCHPFLVHAADRHRGATPRFLAQPGLFWREALDLSQPADRPSPVEKTIRIGLGTL